VRLRERAGGWERRGESSLFRVLRNPSSVRREKNGNRLTVPRLVHVRGFLFLKMSETAKRKRKLRAQRGVRVIRFKASTGSLFLARARVNERRPRTPVHSSTRRFPFFTAHSYVYKSHEHAFARAHFVTRRCPSRAAHARVHSSHGSTFKRSNFNSLSCPLLATALRRCSARNRPRFRRYMRYSALTHPRSKAKCVAATHAPSRITRLTARSVAKSAGLGKFVELKTWCTSTSRGRGHTMVAGASNSCESVARSPPVEVTCAI
jgi:hypothetical protein